MERIFLMFLDHTQRRTTVGRTPLDEWSASRRDLYLTTHDTHNRQISMPPVGFELTISAGERPQAAHLLKSWVRIPPGAWIFVCCGCRVLSGRGLCDELITRPEESYRLCCVVLCDLETSRICASYIYDISNLRIKKKLYAGIVTKVKQCKYLANRVQDCNCYGHHVSYARRLVFEQLNCTRRWHGRRISNRQMAAVSILCDAAWLASNRNMSLR